MNDDWRELDAILAEALDLEPSERPAFLDARCPDPERRARIERLIDDAERDDDSLVAGGAAGEQLGAALAESIDASDTPMDTLAGYRLVRRIGAGGMGEVWEAEQTEPVRRALAVKLVRRGMDSREVLSRFVSERQALAHMSHPGIAQVYDAGLTESGRPYFAMELVDGPPVTEHADRAALSLRERLLLFCDVCDAVQHAHQKGIIHRDIKPSNVLVASVDGRPVPKVIDFGIARAIEGPLSSSTLVTEAGQIVGTPEYMSPEQAGEDPADVDTRADVYALGVILYELLSGALPLERTGTGPAALAELLRQVRETEPRRPSRRVLESRERAAETATACRTTPARLARALRGDLDWIVLRALAKDRARRYGSAAELAEDVRRHLRDEPVVAGPPGTAYRIGKFARRHSGLLTATAAVLVALVAGLAGTWTGLVRARTEALRARTEAAVSAAVNEFLNEDLLASVAPGAQGRDVTMREVLDAAAARLEGRFEDQPVVAATIRRTIGDTYTRLGQFDDASPQLELAAAAFDDALGADHEQTLQTLHRLAELRFYQGRVDEAGDLLLRVAEGRRRTLGPDDPATLAALSDVGVVAHDRGRLDDAERHYRDALDIARRTLPADNQLRLGILHNLGALLKDQARYDEAEPILREAWEATRDSLGPEHPETLTTLSLLGSLLRESGRYDEARPISVDVLEARRRVLGDDHPSTLLSANNLAMLNADLGNYVEAERWQRFALERQRATLGEDHDATILSWGNLGAILTGDGRAAEAEPFLSRAVERSRHALGATHPLTGHTLRKHGAALVALKRWQDAEVVLSESYAVLSESPGLDHPDTRSTASLLAETYDGLGRAADAAAWRARASASDAHAD